MNALDRLGFRFGMWLFRMGLRLTGYRRAKLIGTDPSHDRTVTRHRR